MADEPLRTWLREEAEPFAGWHFAHLAGRWVEEDPPWSYETLARVALRGAKVAVDLGTGGGERLARLSDAFAPTMLATEAYRPNVEVAQHRLAPLGVAVIAYRSEDVVGGPLPFMSGSISVVLARHESYDPREVARVLEPGGRFLTQQVHGRSLTDLREAFGIVSALEVTLERSVSDLREAGLGLDRAEEWWGRSVFRDVGAVVYALRAMPWEVPGFSVTRDEAVLRDLQARLEHEGSLHFKAGRFVIAAHKGTSVDQIGATAVR